MLAVGIGATSSELRTPCAAMSARSAAQSQRSDGVTPHMSGWRTPLETGEPAYDEYGPSFCASSHEVLSAA